MSTKLAIVIADFTSQLATVMDIGATSASLQSAVDDDGNALPSGIYFFALDGNNSQKEHIVCSLSGTSLTNISSVSRQGVQTSGVLRSHRVGATVTLTDFAHLRYINDLLSGATGLDGSNPLAYDGTPTLSSPNQLATKGYVDGVAIGGGANASSTIKGISKLSLDPVSGTNPIAVGDNDTRLPTSAQVGYIPTSDQKNALAGTSGTAPSSTNKFVDNGDTGTSGAGKVLRLDGSGKLPAIDGSQLTGITAGMAVGVVSALLTTSAGNNDVVVSTGFQPRFIILRYWIQGYDSGATNYTQTKGVALYSGTTLVGNDVLWSNDNVADQGGAITAASFSINPTSTSAPSAGSGSGITITLTINAVSSTGFTIRRATTNSGQNARANISYQAFQ